jgi:ankyrin repeat protein
MQQLTTINEFDPNEPNAYGLRPIQIAILRKGPINALLGHPLLELSDLGMGDPPLLMMIRSEHMIEAFYNPPHINLLEEYDGKLILSELVSFSRSDVFVDWLFRLLFDRIRSLVDINAIDQKRKTLLHYAVEIGNESLVSRILEHPGFMPYLGRMSVVLFLVFSLKSLNRQIWRLRNS